MKRSLSVLVLLWAMFVAAATGAAVEVFPLEELEAGMRGHGLTVVRGVNVETFFVEVMDVVAQSPPTPPLIMVRVSGDVIERAGGIAAGMSGSPVYLEDKLLGAIGYGYSMTDHRIGLVTPASVMLAMLEELPTTLAEQPTIQLPEGFRPLQTPLLTSGFSPRVRGFLQERLSEYDFTVQGQAIGLGLMDSWPSLVPGSAIAVQLLRGDFQTGSLGTVTHVEGDKFVGFGHPFTHRGDVELFVHMASIHHTMPHLEFPFKIGSTGPTIGTLLKDRAAGVAGVLDREPPYLPVTMRITDEDRGLEQVYEVDAVKDPSLLEALVISSAYQAVDATLDRVGSGTASVRLEFRGSNLPSRVIRDNMYYSDSDIAVWTLVDLMEGLNLFLHNSLQEVDLTGLDIDIIVEQRRRTASIEKAAPRAFQVQAGDSVEVEVQIRPYRDEVETRILRMDIPPDTLPGIMTVTVRAGGSDYYFGKPSVHTSFQDMEDGDEPIRQVPSGAESLDKLIEQYVNRERGSEIVLEFFPFIDTFPVAEEVDEFPENGEGPILPEMPLPDVDALVKAQLEDEHFDDMVGYEPAWGWNDESNEPIRVRLDTSFVMEGMASFDVEVLPK